ncbi:MAG: cytochrome c-type biogenesis protein [Alphaproteobacteria bacterium]|jgi:cytochrome c-type biogenesis protein CcmH
MKQKIICLVLGLFTLMASAIIQPTIAVTPDEVLSNPALETRARALSKNLRCLVCQNQSIDDSDADLARDLRILVRERLTNGDTDQQVLDFLTARYGDFVLLKPPVKPATWALWFGPLLVLIIAILGIVIRLRRKAQPGTPGEAAPALSPEEQAALKRLMDKGPS